MTYVIAVDDDPEVLETLGRVLEREKFEVDLLASSQQVMIMLGQRRPDLLILDIIMPGQDGIAVCRQLRQDQRFADLPILFLTALDDLDTLQKCSDAGGSDFLVKDGSPDSLIQRVDYWVRLRAGLVPEDERRPDLSNFVGVAASA